MRVAKRICAHLLLQKALCAQKTPLVAMTVYTERPVVGQKDVNPSVHLQQCVDIQALGPPHDEMGMG